MELNGAHESIDDVLASGVEMELEGLKGNGGIVGSAPHAPRRDTRSVALQTRPLNLKTRTIGVRWRIQINGIGCTACIGCYTVAVQLTRAAGYTGGTTL